MLTFTLTVTKKLSLGVYPCLCCFQLMGEEPDLDPDITRDFFERNILQLDASLLTENGIKSVHFQCCYFQLFAVVILTRQKSDLLSVQ